MYMAENVFNVNIADSQGTEVAPVAPEDFDYDRYQSYVASLIEKNRAFWESKSGVAVYRRFRVPQVYSYECRDMQKSLSMQLGALNESMEYKMDIPNFLEPWYGIGITASAFGLDYIWHENLAPAMKAPFDSVEEALNFNYKPIEETKIGKHVLEMIEYFMDKTKGKIPISLTDTQSPLNTASYLISINNMFMEIYDNPGGFKKLLMLLTDLTVEFSKKQMELIGDALANPGHGFPSSRVFKGIGFSADAMTMVSDDIYREFELPCLEKAGREFGGIAFHSCGNWTRKVPTIKEIKNLVMVDGAFSNETDPDPNQEEGFVEELANSNIILNARIVGNGQTVVEKVKKLWKSGMKLIVTTYCQSQEEQEFVYNSIHEICK